MAICDTDIPQLVIVVSYNLENKYWHEVAGNGKKVLEKFHLIYANIIYIQYWSIDGEYRNYLTRLRNGEKDELQRVFHPFRAQPHKLYIHRQQTNAVFMLKSTMFLEIILTNDCISC